MKVSKTIQDKMHKVAELNSQADELMKEIDAYFEDKGFNIDLLRCGNGVSLEELEYGNDITDKFVKEAENNFKSDVWDLYD